MHTLRLSVLRIAFASAVPALFLGGLLALGSCNPMQRAETDSPLVTAAHVRATDPVEAGRYLVMIGGCNDCHTAGYPEANGAVPESEWLTGVPIGFRGPWGTSYPSNLRLLVQDLTEDAWVTMSHTRQTLPPMPWPSLNHMNEEDARAIYRFIHSLGAKGNRMPLAIGPDQEPTTPYFVFEPQHMERLQPAVQGAPSTPASVSVAGNGSSTPQTTVP